MQLWSADGVRQERTGWRCAAISERHRKWGWNCPAADLDFVMCEYNYGKPVALIEYKHAMAQPPVVSSRTYQALGALADGYRDGPLPFLIAHYDPERWWFRVQPLNEPARLHWGHVGDATMTEQRYVRGLLLLRKRLLSATDEAIIAGLNDIMPGLAH